MARKQKDKAIEATEATAEESQVQVTPDGAYSIHAFKLSAKEVANWARDAQVNYRRVNGVGADLGTVFQRLANAAGAEVNVTVEGNVPEGAPAAIVDTFNSAYALDQQKLAKALTNEKGAEEAGIEAIQARLDDFVETPNQRGGVRGGSRKASVKEARAKAQKLDDMQSKLQGDTPEAQAAREALAALGLTL